ncbi:MAG TPA: DNA damage-inducible protein D [Ignavibacteria bacterium]|nr:DNA damage-inducible protein D [Ignavibacteria bacterium]
MKIEIIAKYQKSFEQYVHNENDTEYWLARELQELLGYKKWENFSKVIEKAIIACENSGQDKDDHFLGVTKLVDMPKGGTKSIDDIMLTRYACYLITQNGDPRKEKIAFAQSYFALQTRKQELLEKRINEIERVRARKKLSQTEKELSGILYERGVDNKGFARIRSKGDQALFGGMATNMMKFKLSVPKNRPLADFLPTITIKAKDFANEITNFNVQKEDMKGEERITKEHIKNNAGVRKLLKERGIIPENLPPEEDIKKVERRLKSEDKKLLKGTKKLKNKK